MKRITGILVSLVSMFLLVSCEPGEVYHYEEGYISNIFTVNKATLQPEFEDTLYRVINHPNDFGLETGDRAHILLHYYFDAYSGKKPEWDIVSVVEKIPTLDIAPREDVDASSYDLPLDIYEYELLQSYQWPIWIWENRLNVNVRFGSVAEKTDFVMSLRGIENDTVRLNLLAKTTAPSDTLYTKLLSYDLNNINTLFTEEEKNSLQDYEKLIFRIYLKNKDANGNMCEEKWGVMKGQFVNPLHK